MEHGTIIFICLLSGAVAFAAFILWIRDRGGPLGKTANGFLMALIAITGVVCLINGTRTLILNSEVFLSKEFQFAFWTIMQLLIGIQFMWIFGKWLIGRKTGTEGRDNLL
jgi:hypothetical protein